MMRHGELQFIEASVTDKAQGRDHGLEYALAMWPIPGMSGLIELKVCQAVEGQ